MEMLSNRIKHYSVRLLSELKSDTGRGWRIQGFIKFTVCCMHTYHIFVREKVSFDFDFQRVLIYWRYK
jgi:hypothetical protein